MLFCMSHTLFTLGSFSLEKKKQDLTGKWIAHRVTNRKLGTKYHELCVCMCVRWPGFETVALFLLRMHTNTLSFLTSSEDLFRSFVSHPAKKTRGKSVNKRKHAFCTGGFRMHVFLGCLKAIRFQDSLNLLRMTVEEIRSLHNNHRRAFHSNENNNISLQLVSILRFFLIQIFK